MNYKIEILDTAYEFISSLETKFRAKTYRTIGLLKEFGPFLKEPHSKSSIYIITSGFIKKDDKLIKADK